MEDGTMDREEALDSIEANVESANLIKHMLATEAFSRMVSDRIPLRGLFAASFIGRWPNPR